jgi:hypothetical protein
MGLDIYVLGSGPSLQHIPLDFWQGKVIVSTNHGCTLRGIKPDYLVTKYHHHAREYAERFPASRTVVTRHDRGDVNQPQIEPGPWIVLDHDQNLCERWDGQWPEPGKFLVTFSTITTAMHWAMHLGARNVILAGHDCGWIGESGRVDGYRRDSEGHGRDDDSHLWSTFSAQTALVKQQLWLRFGVTVTSVNPFINLALEGHEYRKA